MEAARILRRPVRRVPRGARGLRRGGGAHPRRLPAEPGQRRPRHPREVARVPDDVPARGRRARRGRRGAAPRLGAEGRGRAGDRARRRRRQGGAGGVGVAASCISRTPRAPAARWAARSRSSPSSCAPAGAASASACASTPATCSPPATTCAHRGRRRGARALRRRGGLEKLAPCTSTTRCSRWAPTATVTRRWARARWARTAAPRSCPPRRSRTCPASSRRSGDGDPPGGPAREQIELTEKLRKRGRKARGLS